MMTQLVPTTSDSASDSTSDWKNSHLHLIYRHSVEEIDTITIVQKWAYNRPYLARKRSISDWNLWLDQWLY